MFEETSYYLKDITFIDADTGWAVGDVHWDQAQWRYVGTMIKTTDGGVTWERIETGEGAALNGLFFVGPDQGWVVGDYGVILRCGGAS